MKIDCLKAADTSLKLHSLLRTAGCPVDKKEEIDALAQARIEQGKLNALMSDIDIDDSEATVRSQVKIIKPVPVLGVVG